MQDRLSVNLQIYDESYDIAEQHHPKWSTLSNGARALHARNVEIVRPCIAVFACPGSAPWGGGTAMGIKIAKHIGVVTEVFDEMERNWDSCGCKEAVSG
ncbi:MAG: hypothetical protein GTO63_11530 [Anaerolineae bacterium]|nr:hypothetical protein [Anaerolineae bacterium]NIN95491.1 hypothetical protein [Anaerolineae bacterium]NIQ78475.1 hypothetical protein [Anaerolineae bacterium]